MKKLLLFFVLLLVTTNLYSQNQVISRLKQPPPNRFGISDLWSIDLNNTTRKDIKGYIVGTLSEDRDGLIVEAKTKIFTIKAGQHTYTQKDFSDADINFNKTNYKETLLRTGGFPYGDYTICITVYNEADEVIGLENCIYHSVRQLGNISLLSPADGDEIDLEQPIIFSWTPLPDAKEYSLKIVELIGNQSPVVALEQNPPFFTKANIKATQFQYPLNERKFQSEKSYAWVISSNGVLSDIGLFTVKPSVIVSSDKLTTKYRFTLMYPDGGISESRIENFESELKELAKILNGDSDVKSEGITIPKQTQGATFGERVNSNLINFLSEESTAELGEEILILIGGNPVGELQNCPPPGCGCRKDGGINCSCRNWGGFCLCLLCPIINTMDIIEELLPPPNDDNGKKTKDILIILENDLTKIDESLNDIVKLGLNKIAELRKNKIEAFTVKLKYNVRKSNTNNFGEIIEQANDNFRLSVSNVLTRLSNQYKLPINDNFVFVSPHSLLVSPVTLMKGLENISTNELAAGKDVLFTFFNLPQGSEIASGFYSVSTFKDTRSGEWKAELKDLTGKIILKTNAEVKSGNYSTSKGLPGRALGYYDGKFGVRFGFQINNLTFNTFLILSTDKLNKNKFITEGEEILSALTILRAQVEPALKNSTQKAISDQILIATREDAFLVGALFKDKIINSDGTQDICYIYLNIPGIEKGFYSVSISKKENYRKGYLKNSDGNIIKEFDVNVSYGEGKEIGLVGGIINSEVSLQIISSKIIEGKGLIEITLKF
uniref:Uncharacterized protein n=1 Tax=Ignavibacterium album TaxID=591197 RepID=A0A832CYN0_9BACT